MFFKIRGKISISNVFMLYKHEREKFHYLLWKICTFIYILFMILIKSYVLKIVLLKIYIRIYLRIIYFFTLDIYKIYILDSLLNFKQQFIIIFFLLQ